ncbi:MAG: DNA recombination protein RmuC [Saprospiraceae bacterium]|nr:DNA recombination protein RmuC [Saprospiraceae bacterium]
MSPVALGWILLVLGLLTGGLLGWLIARLYLLRVMTPKSDLEQNFVQRPLYDALQTQYDLCREDLHEKLEEIKILTGQNAAQQQSLTHFQEKLATQKDEVQALQERARLDFENLANRLLEEKSQKFTAQNQQQLGDLLNPLREKIKEFEDNIDKRFREEMEGRVSLKKEIEHLRELNQQLSHDANNLVSALKGGQKTQGDWGEVQLEMLLEKAGLEKNVHYTAQSSFKDEEGKQKRPDFIVHLPEDKHLIIDAKVSLTAYEQFFNAESPEAERRHLKAHIDSIRNHIKGLSSKNYQQLYHINSPDYLLLFVPIEPAFAIALKEDQRLFLDALDHNIVLVTTSTLLATMRTVSYIWKQEKQKRSVLEIARQSGLLYDRLCAFVDDLKNIGARIDQAQESWHDAMNKLTDAKRPGDTLIGRAEKIKALGAKTSRQLPDLPA